MKKTKLLKEEEFQIQIFVAAMPFLMGLYSQYQLLIAALIWLFMLFRHTIKNKEMVIYTGINTVLGTVFLICSVLSCIAVPGMGRAYYGVVRILALVPCIFFMMQPDINKTKVFTYLPESASLMVLISSLGYLSPSIKEILFYKNRMGGFFQYPNTFAFYLLFSLVLLWNRQSKKQWFYIFEICILTAGLFLTGSRTTFVLFVITVFYLVIRDKKRILILIAVAGCFLVVAGVSFFLWGNESVFGRVLNLSFTDTYVLERLLFWKDALPQILHYPLGMGYGGYYSLQKVFQTGVYTTRFVHNGFLQCFLDYGIAAGIILIILILKSVKQQDTLGRLLLGVLLLRSCFDFDLQFGAILYLFVILLDFRNDSDRKIVINKQSRRLMTIIFLPLMCLFSWMFLADFLLNTGQAYSAYRIFPYDGEIAEVMLGQQTDYQEAYNFAKELTDRNPYSAIGWKIRSYALYERGQYKEMSDALHRYIQLEKFNQSVYRDYIELHYVAGLKCLKQRDTEQALELFEEGCEVENIRLRAEKSVSDLAKACKDDARLKWTAQDKQILSEMKEIVLNYKN